MFNRTIMQFAGQDRDPTERGKLMPTGLRLLSDLPVGEGVEGRGSIFQTEDLGFKHCAEALGQAALDTEGPLTIGVYGRWGTGKTSLMRLAMQVVDEDRREGKKRALPVWFNAWQYEREEHLIIPLMVAIAKTMKDQENELSEAARPGAKCLSRTIRSVLYGLSLSGKIRIPWVGEAGVDVSPSKMIDREAQLLAREKEMEQIHSLYSDAFEKLRQLTHKSGVEKPKIVVFIDDLDRCLPPRALDLLESIKLVLCQPGFVFFLGVYPQILQSYIQSKYLLEYHVQERHCEDYLDKIIQVPVHVPECKDKAIYPHIRRLMREGNVFSGFASNLAGQESSEEENIVHLIADACEDNPRAVVRLLNSILLSRYEEEAKKKQETASGDPNPGIHTGMNGNQPESVNAKTDDRAFNSLITHAIRRERYRPIHEALHSGSSVILPEDKSLDFTRFLIKQFKEFFPNRPMAQFLQDLKALALQQPDEAVKEALFLLSQKQHLCHLFGDERGLKWLRNHIVSVYRVEGESLETVSSGSPASRKKLLRRLQQGEDPMTIPSLLEHLKLKNKLPIWARPFVRGIEPIQEMEHLDWLELTECPALESIDPLVSLTALHSLDLSGCTHLKDLEALRNKPALEKLRLSRCTSLEHLGPLRKIGSLTHLWLEGCTAVESIEPLNNLKALKELSLSGCVSLDSLDPLRGLRKLEVLDLHNCGAASENLAFLRSLTALRNLDLSGWLHLVDLNLNVLKYLLKLEALSLAECKRLTTLPSKGSANIDRLDLFGCSEIQDLNFLSSMTSLKTLTLGRCTKASNFDALKALGNLNVLDLSETLIGNLKVLRNATKLERLSLYKCSNINDNDIHWLIDLPALQELNLIGCLGIRDLGGLENCPGSLHEIYISDRANVKIPPKLEGNIRRR